MIGSSKVFFDSAPFIYLVENNPKYYWSVANFVADAIQEEKTLFTSVITIAETYVKPYKSNDLLLLKDFESTLRTLNFTIVGIDFNIANLSAKLRARYPFLKGLDSMQIAAALSLNANLFVTNDSKLQSIQEIEILMIDNLI